MCHRNYFFLFLMMLIACLPMASTLAEDDIEITAEEIQSFSVQFYKIFDDKFYYVKSSDITYGREWFVHELEENESGELVVDINDNANSAIPSTLTEDDVVELNGRLYFLADNGDDGIELWSTDGTEAGTTMVEDIEDNDFGQTTVNDRDPQQLRIFGDDIIFFVSSEVDTNQYDIWKTDGTTTTEIETEVERIDNSQRIEFLATDDTFYFVTFDESKRYILWESDGTEAGTNDLETFEADKSLKELVEFNNELYFIYDDRSLYKTDGGENNSEQVFDFLTDTSITPSVYFLRAFNNQLLMAVTDDSNGRELWVSGGNDNDTEILDDIYPGSSSGITSNFFSPLEERTTYELTVYNEFFYFPADDSFNGNELWRTDGTEDGTEIVFDNISGTIGSNPRDFLLFEDDLYFIAENDDGSDYIYRITAEEPDEVEEVIDDLDSLSDRAQSIREIVEMNNQLYFIEDNDVGGVTLWRIDETIDDDDQPDSLTEFWFGRFDYYLISFLLMLLILRRKHQPSSQSL